jgi:AraC-like DNA-binding protein
MAGFRAQFTDPIDIRFVPHPAVTLVIDLGQGLVVDDASGQPKQGSLAAGLAPGAFRVHLRDVDCLHLRLSPVVAHAMLGIPSELGGTVVALEDLWGRDAVRMQEQLRAARSWDDRFALTEAALARHQAGPAVDPEVAFAWGQMVASRGQVRVEQLAAEAGWSRKRLWSRFRSQVGLTPKRAAQLVRFDHAARRLAAGHSAALVAADSGYVDQSHLHHDVKAFAEMTPTAVAAAVAAAPWLSVNDIARMA